MLYTGNEIAILHLSTLEIQLHKCPYTLYGSICILSQLVLALVGVCGALKMLWCASILCQVGAATWPQTSGTFPAHLPPFLDSGVSALNVLTTTFPPAVHIKNQSLKKG